MSEHRQTTFGISLGSANCVIAVAHASTDRQDVCADDNGERSTPIAVAFVNGEKVTGLTAKNAAVRNPRNVLNAIVPLMSAEAEMHASATKMSCITQVAEDGSVTFPSLDAEQENRTPAECLVIFFAKLKELLQNAAGEGDVTAVTIAVPRHVDHAAVLAAAKEVELVTKGATLRVVADDTAIAMTALPQLAANAIQEANIAEGTEMAAVAAAQKATRDESGLVVVVDWGANTLAINALELAGGILTHVHGDRKVGMGGTQLDKKVANIAAEGFQRKTKCDPSDDARAMRKLTAAAEGCKIALSQCMVSSMEIDAFSNGTDLQEQVQRMRLDMAYDMMGANAAYKTMLEEVVEEAKKKTGAEVLTVVLAGGQLRVPRCNTQVKSITNVVIPDVKIVAAPLTNEQAAIGACLVATALHHHTGEWTSGTIQAPVLSYNLVVGAAADKVDETAATTLIAVGSALPITVEIAVANFAAGKTFGLAVGQVKKAGDAAAWFGVADVATESVSVTVAASGEVTVYEGQRSAQEIADLKTLATFSA